MGNCASVLELDEPMVINITEEPEINMKEDDLEAVARTSERLNINTCEASNENIGSELESMENKDEYILEQAAQNDELRKELSEMKVLIEEKDRALVKYQLEAALHSKAIPVITSETVTKLLKAGIMSKFGRAGKAKPKEKWVEIHVHGAQITDGGLSKGCVMLSYADKKGAVSSNRYKILRIKKPGVNVAAIKSKALSMNVVSSGVEKELVFLCLDSKMQQDWINSIKDGFRMIEEEFVTLKNAECLISLDVEISKEKLGIRVEERHIETMSDLDEKAAVVTSYEAETNQAEENIMDKENGAETDEAERPCELVVIEISDPTLFTTGLSVGCVLGAINGMNIRGLPYIKQHDMLLNTEKPFKITFLKRKFEQRTAFPGILKELTADGDNTVKSAFYEIVNGTEFGIELEKSENKTATITELLSNQQRLTGVLENAIKRKN